MKSIYQIQIALKDSKPKIWRRILVQSDVKLDDFHRILQTTMGWTNSHLHQFSAGPQEYAPEEFEIDGAKDSRKVKLEKILNEKQPNILYEYDFGDGWEHSIILEKTLPFDDKVTLPVCLAGKRNCPPEDCGGIWGYGDLLEILSNPGHPEYEEWIEWVGEDFDPADFDKEFINEQLQQKDYGCIWL